MVYVSRILWMLSLLGAFFAAVNFFLTYASEVWLRSSPDIGAQQVAALSSVSLVFAVVPYVLARGWDELTRPR